MPPPTCTWRMRFGANAPAWRMPGRRSCRTARLSRSDRTRRSNPESVLGIVRRADQKTRRRFSLRRWLVPGTKVDDGGSLGGIHSRPAYAANMETRLGRLAPNYLADLIVLDALQDPYLCPEDLLAMQSSATMVGGEWVHTSATIDGGLS